MTLDIKGNALCWFQSRLSNKSLFVHITNESSSHTDDHGDPQGSVLGLILFTKKLKKNKKNKVFTGHVALAIIC